MLLGMLGQFGLSVLTELTGLSGLTGLTGPQSHTASWLGTQFYQVQNYPTVQVGQLYLVPYTNTRTKLWVVLGKRFLTRAGGVASFVGLCMGRVELDRPFPTGRHPPGLIPSSVY